MWMLKGLCEVNTSRCDLIYKQSGGSSTDKGSLCHYSALMITILISMITDF